MSDTPRTDDFYYERSRIPSDRAWLKYARQLERELAACQQECKDREAAVMVDLAAANARVEKLKADRDKLLVMASRMADAINRCQDEDDCSDLSAAYDFRQEYPR